MTARIRGAFRTSGWTACHRLRGSSPSAPATWTRDASRSATSLGNSARPPPARQALYTDATLSARMTNRAPARRSSSHAFSLAKARVVAKPMASCRRRSEAVRRGRPRLTASDLRRHEAIGFATTRAFASENAWLEERLAGARFVMRADSVASVYSACLAGGGLALLPRLVADRDASLVQVAGAEGLEPRSLWQAVHPDVLKAPRIRAVIEFLKEILSAEAPPFAPR